MGTFGRQLRRERENRGLRLIDVSRKTRVGVHHLAALEHEDFAALPDAVFVKGYLRAYAECLGLDPSALVAEYLDEVKSRHPAAAVEGQDPLVREMSRLLVREDDQASRPWIPAAAAGAGLFVFVAVLGGWWWFSDDDAGPRERERAAAIPSPAAPATQPPAAPASDLVSEAPLASPPAPEVPPPPAAAPPPPPARASAPVAASPHLAVTESGVGTGIVDRRLVGRATSFEPGAQVYFWTRVTGGRASERIRHVWFHDERKIASVPLTLGGSHWRTQSRQTLWNRGTWRVEAHDAEGRVLARVDFACAGPG
jgi:cytoskeletal protein RodZ